MGSSNSTLSLNKEYPQVVQHSPNSKNPSNKPQAASLITLTSPISQYYVPVLFASSQQLISACILPGLDLTKSPNQKTCQDNYSFIIFQSTIFLMLFDGHGPNGHLIADFCIDFCTKFFYTNFKDFLYDTKSTLKSLFLACDDELKTSSINSEFSGSTCVISFMTTSEIHTASVGDSRAVLLSISPSTYMHAFQLTNDQKPNHKEEYKRIKAAGGSVRRYIDPSGVKRGPYRLWFGESNCPGLAMSRSIGDFLAKSIGAVATPIYSTLKLQSKDKFFVVASDGIWDVMSNQEVTDFVNEFYSKCNSNIGKKYPATQENSTIARFLCEEARSRWTCSDRLDRSTIDDISCVIVQLEILENQDDIRNVQIVNTIDGEEYCRGSFE